MTRRIDLIFVGILLAALGLRLYLAASAPYIHDEDQNAIALASTISFDPATLNLPIRGENHLALPAYVVKAGSLMFGTTPLGYRLMHVLLGLATVVVVYLLARGTFGPIAARWAAALMAFNEFYLFVSARATAHVPHLFLITLALYAFSRFLVTERAGFLYGAGAAVGLAFYCKEHAALLLPVFFLALLQRRYRPWLRRPQVYLACGLFVLAIVPDIVWNMTTDPEVARVTYGDQPAAPATYSAHLRRVGGVGLSPYPAMFYARDVVRGAYARVTGSELYDETPEYRSVNPLLGLLFVGAAVLTVFGPVRRAPAGAFLLLAFWVVFAFFTLIKKGDPPGRLSPVSWMWVEATIVPAAILAGAWLAGVPARWRVVAWGFAAAVLVYAAGALLA